MAFCTNCGTQVAEGTAYCTKCGARITSSAPAPPPVSASSAPPPQGSQANVAPAQSATASIQENVAGLLCYVLGWITGLIFLLIDKRPFVRFHAAQSIVVFGGLNILYILLGHFFLVGIAVGGAVGFGLGSLLFLIIRLGALILWILLMVKAYQGERYRLPLAGEYADSLAGKVRA